MASTSSASDASSGGPSIWIGESSAPARTLRTSPARRSIGSVTQRRMSSAATIAPMTATTAIDTNSADSTTRIRSSLSVARSASIWSFVPSAARLDRTRLKSFVDVPLVISAIAAAGPDAFRSTISLSACPRHLAAAATTVLSWERSSAVSSSLCRSRVSSAARARPPVNGSRNPVSPVSAYPRWPVSWSV